MDCRVLALLVVPVLASAEFSLADTPRPHLPGRMAVERSQRVDRWGRVVYEDGARRPNYGPHKSQSVAAPRPASRNDGRRMAGPGTGTGGDVRLEWDHAVMGAGIGATGLHVADLAGDGVQRIAAGAAVGGTFGENNYWYILSKRSTGYEKDWISESYSDPISSLVIADADGDGGLEVLVGVGGRILVYDGATHTLESELATVAGSVSSLVVADVDADGSNELAFCDTWYWSPGPLFVVDAATGALEFHGDALPCRSVAVGNVDGDPGLEIVLGQGSDPGWVLDGATRAVEWANSFGFGDIVRLGDLDADGRQEVISGFNWDDIRIFDADLQSLKGSIAVDGDLDALRVVDLEGDGNLEIVYGDGQWGSVYVHDGGTLAQEWAVANPEHGVTDVAVGDCDGDGTKELLWGAGYSSSGPDYLYVVDTTTRVQEWRSQDVNGPFYALSHGDVDGDGQTEILHASYGSESGYGDGLYFVHDATTHELEYQSGELTDLNWTGIWKIRSANVDSDPQQEIFVPTSSTYDGILICLDGATHIEQWRATLPSGLTYASLALEDVDVDGELEVIAGVLVEHTGAPGVYVYVYDAASGSLEWQSPSLPSTWMPLALLRVANVDADPQPEIVVAAETAGLYLIDVVAGTTQALGDYAPTALETADLDGDGIQEILVGTESGQILVLGPVPEVLRTVGAAIYGLGARDVDHDGIPDLVFVAGSEMFVYDSAGALLWRSGPLPDGAGERDSLLVADVDVDGFVEIMVGLGFRGLRVYEVHQLPTQTLSIADQSVIEANTTTTASFTVSLSAVSGVPVTADYSTEPDTATPDSDYTPVAGTLTFAPGVTTQTIDVPILGDFVQELTESFRVLLSNPAFASIAKDAGVGTIVDDDLSGFSIDDVTVTELASGTVAASFTVSLAPTQLSAASVDFATEDGTAVSPADYTATSGTLDFPPGTLTRTATVLVNADSEAEAAESFGMRLSNPIGAVIGRALGVGTIRDHGSTGFYTLSPCRVLDTRTDAGGALQAGTGRDFPIGGLCGVPLTAKAVSLTITATNATAVGNVRLLPGGAPPLQVSNVNYVPGVTRAGNGVIPLSSSGMIAAYCSQATGSVDLILDVTGYFQ